MNDIIVVPRELPHGPTYGEWRIVQTTRKLMVKYGFARYPSFHTREFDRYAATRRTSDPAWGDRVEGADLAVTTLMHSGVRDNDYAVLMRRAPRIERVLRAVADSCTIEGKTLSNEAKRAVRSLLGSCIGMPGFRMAKVTKLLSLKRPNLIPMLDSYVLGFLFAKERPLPASLGLAESCVQAIAQFHALMNFGANRQVLMAACASVSQRLRRAGVGVRVGPIRALESVLWFDWEGYRNFGWVHRRDKVVAK